MAERLVVWVILAAIYGGVLALLVQLMGQTGIVIWLILVVVLQLWLRQRAKQF